MSLHCKQRGADVVQRDKWIDENQCEEEKEDLEEDRWDKYIRKQQNGTSERARTGLVEVKVEVLRYSIVCEYHFSPVFGTQKPVVPAVSMPERTNPRQTTVRTTSKRGEVRPGRMPTRDRARQARRYRYRSQYAARSDRAGCQPPPTHGVGPFRVVEAIQGHSNSLVFWNNVLIIRYSGIGQLSKTAGSIRT
jgi:hypothetical protein